MFQFWGLFKQVITQIFENETEIASCISKKISISLEMTVCDDKSDGRIL